MFDLSVLLNVEMQILILFRAWSAFEEKRSHRRSDRCFSVDVDSESDHAGQYLPVLLPQRFRCGVKRKSPVGVGGRDRGRARVGDVAAFAQVDAVRKEAHRTVFDVDIQRFADRSAFDRRAVRKHGVVYANIFMIPTRILSFSSGEKYFNTEWKPAGALSVMKKFFFNPITIAMILGFLFNLARIPLPGGLDAVFSSLSGCMSPLALLLVGSTLLDRESTSMGLSKDIVQISLFRLIIAPFLTWIVGVALHLSTPQLIAAVLVNATPVASTATIFCRKYNGNTSYTSRCVFFSTVFSVYVSVGFLLQCSMG